MSVLKNKRAQSSVQFLETAKDLHIFTMRTCKKYIPKAYTFYISIPIVNIALNIHSCVKRGNSIFPSKLQDVMLRREQFVMAGAELQNLISQINIVYDMFPIADNTMIKWLDLVNQEIALIKNVIKKDEERYKNIK